MPKFVFMPPQDDLKTMFAARLADTVPRVRSRRAPDRRRSPRSHTRRRRRLRMGPPPPPSPSPKNSNGSTTPTPAPSTATTTNELIAHPLTITNPRGIYYDHISHHIMMFVFALSRGLPWYFDAQRNRVWDKDARKTPYIYLGESTALINGVGGIGHGDRPHLRPARHERHRHRAAPRIRPSPTSNSTPPTS